MIFHRKNFDNIWSLFKLGKEDVATVETVTITNGLRTLQKINKVAAEANMKLTEQDRAAMLVWAALTFESYGSDYIEAKVAAEKKAAAEAALATSSAQ